MSHKDHGIGFFFGKDRRRTRRSYHAIKDKPYNKNDKANDESIQTQATLDRHPTDDME